MSLHDPAHPGEILRELVIEPLGLSVTDAARHLGVSRKTVSKVLHARGAVTPEMALRLEMTFGKPDAAHWLRLQSAYDQVGDRSAHEDGRARGLPTRPRHVSTTVLRVQSVSPLGESLLSKA